MLLPDCLLHGALCYPPARISATSVRVETHSARQASYDQILNTNDRRFYLSPAPPATRLLRTDRFAEPWLVITLKRGPAIHNLSDPAYGPYQLLGTVIQTVHTCSVASIPQNH